MNANVLHASTICIKTKQISHISLTPCHCKLVSASPKWPNTPVTASLIMSLYTVADTTLKGSQVIRLILDLHPAYSNTHTIDTPHNLPCYFPTSVRTDSLGLRPCPMAFPWCFIDLFLMELFSPLLCNRKVRGQTFNILLNTQEHFHWESVVYRVIKLMSFHLHPHWYHRKYKKLLIPICPETEGKHLVEEVDDANRKI